MYRFETKKYNLYPCKWKDYNIEDSDDWEKIKNILVHKGGLLLQASPGTGKTYTALKLLIL